MIGRLDKQKTSKGRLSQFESFLEDKYQSELSEITNRNNSALARINAKEAVSRSQRILTNPLHFSDFGLGDLPSFCDGKPQYWKQRSYRLRKSPQNTPMRKSQATRNNVSGSYDLSQSLNTSEAQKLPNLTSSRVLSKKNLLDASENNDYNLGINQLSEKQRVINPHGGNLKQKQLISSDEKPKAKTIKVADITERLIQDLLKDDENDDVDLLHPKNILKSLDAINQKVAAMPEDQNKTLVKSSLQNPRGAVTGKPNIPKLPLLTPRLNPQEVISAKGLSSARDFAGSEKRASPVYIPTWLRHKPHFLNSLKDSRIYDPLKISIILGKAPHERGEFESKALLDYLAGIKLFSGFTNKQLLQLVDSIYLIKLQEGDVLCRKNSPATCLWILVEGEIALYQNETKIGTVKDGEVIGKEALDSDKRRLATLEVQSPNANVIVLSAFDFVRINMNIEDDYATQAAICNFLLSLPFLKNMKNITLHNLSTKTAAKRFLKSQVICQKGETANEFFILRKGRVEREAVLRVKKKNRWPAAANMNTWGKNKIVTNVAVTIPAEVGEIFGLKEIEFLLPREEKVVAVEEAIVYCIERDAVEQILSSEEYQELLKYYQEEEAARIRKLRGLKNLNESDIVSKIEVEEQLNNADVSMKSSKGQKMKKGLQISTKNIQIEKIVKKQRSDGNQVPIN